MNENRTGTNLSVRILTAVLLAATGLVHIYLVFAGTGGVLGALFIANGIAGIALAIALIWTRGELLHLSSILGLLFLVVSLVALLLALTAGLFGITETWSNPFVMVTVIVEAIGIVVSAICVAKLRSGTARS